MALIFEVKVVPSSGVFKIVRDKKGDLKCYLKAAPEKGEANKELVKCLAKMLRIPQSDIEIIIGLTNRKKTIKVHGAFTIQEFCKILDVPCQQDLGPAFGDDSCSSL